MELQEAIRSSGRLKLDTDDMKNMIELWNASIRTVIETGTVFKEKFNHPDKLSIHTNDMKNMMELWNLSIRTMFEIRTVFKKGFDQPAMMLSILLHEMVHIFSTWYSCMLVFLHKVLYRANIACKSSKLTQKSSLLFKIKDDDFSNDDRKYSKKLNSAVENLDMKLNLVAENLDTDLNTKNVNQIFIAKIISSLILIYDDEGIVLLIIFKNNHRQVEIPSSTSSLAFTSTNLPHTEFSFSLLILTLCSFLQAIKSRIR